MASYTPKQKEDIFIKVLDFIRNGMSLRSALKQDGVFSRTVWDELVVDEDKKAQYTCAREERSEFIFEDIINISDNVEQDIITLPDGREVENKAVIARDRLRVDARKWALSKMNPRKYGEKIQTEHSGEIKTTDPNINLIVEGKTINMKEESK